MSFTVKECRGVEPYLCDAKTLAEFPTIREAIAYAIQAKRSNLEIWCVTERWPRGYWLSHIRTPRGFWHPCNLETAAHPAA